jgi:hypothetical protein
MPGNMGKKMNSIMKKVRKSNRELTGPREIMKLRM